MADWQIEVKTESNMLKTVEDRMSLRQMCARPNGLDTEWVEFKKAWVYGSVSLRMNLFGTEWVDGGMSLILNNKLSLSQNEFEPWE